MENSQLLEHIGKTKTDNLIRDIQKEYFEQRQKKFENKNETINPMSVVSAIKDGEIKSLGMSCISDLLLDNWGKFYACFLGRTNQQVMQDISNITRNFNWSGTNRMWNNQYNSCGTSVQIGQGATPAQITDYGINTPFVGGIESTRRSTGIGFYTVGLSTANVSTHWSPMSQNGSIAETVFFLNMRDESGATITRVIAISRDNISPVVNFSIGEQVNVDYSFLFN